MLLQRCGLEVCMPAAEHITPHGVIGVCRKAINDTYGPWYVFLHVPVPDGSGLHVEVLISTTWLWATEKWPGTAATAATTHLISSLLPVLACCAASTEAARSISTVSNLQLPF